MLLSCFDKFQVYNSISYSRSYQRAGTHEDTQKVYNRRPLFDYPL